MMKQVLAALAVMAATTPAAHALSCMRSDVARSFKAAQASEDRYIVVRGELQFNTRLMPRGSCVENQMVDCSTTISAQFSGKSLGLEGFSNDFVTDVSINIGCAGPWCGGIASGHPFVMFMRQSPSGYQLDVGACPTWSFDGRDRETAARVTSCLRGQDCEPQDQF